MLAPSAFAAERTPGTCLTLEGVWLAPWTDAYDPACGPDCGEADDDSDAALCADEACFIEGATMVPRLPAPTGPRCLDGGPTCSEGDGGVPASFSIAGGVALQAPTPRVPRRASGSLPAAGLPEFSQVLVHHYPLRDSPPPRA